MQSQAAGIVVFRGQNDELEFLLVARRSLSLSLSLALSLALSLSRARTAASTQRQCYPTGRSAYRSHLLDGACARATP